MKKNKTILIELLMVFYNNFNQPTDQTYKVNASLLSKSEKKKLKKFLNLFLL